VALEFIEENGEWLSEFHKEIWHYAEPAFGEYRSIKAHEKPLNPVNDVWE